MLTARLNDFRQKLPKLNVMYWCLIAIGCFEFLLMVIGTRDDVYYLCKNNMVIPTLMFFGAAFTTRLTPSAKRKLLLGTLAVVWFIIVQIHRDVLDWRIHPYSWFLSTYLMAYPFAAVTEDGEKATGLKLYAGVFLAAACVLVSYGVLLLTNKVPEEYVSFIYFHEGSRFALMSNPNISGCILMIATVFCLTGFLKTEKRWIKYMSFLLGCVFFLTMVLTNSRTVVLITCAMIGGCVFFHYFTGGWKRFFLALLAAGVVIVSLFFSSEKIYDYHRHRLLAQYNKQLEEITEPAAAVPETPVNISDISISSSLSNVALGLPSTVNLLPANVSLSTTNIEDLSRQIHFITTSSKYRTFASHFGTLNGRTEIWWSALRSIREDPSILIWGCENVGDTISQYMVKYQNHTHNSWAEITLSLGVPGAIISVVFTWITFWNAMVLLWNKLVPLWKKCVALFVLGLLVVAVMEPYLFFTHQGFHFIDFTFFLCLGYVRVWVEELPRKFDTQKFPFCLL